MSVPLKDARFRARSGAAFSLAPGLGALTGSVAHAEVQEAHGEADAHGEGDAGEGGGPEVVFYAEVPSVGDYRLFLDFQHEDVVRTAELTVDAGESDH